MDGPVLTGLVSAAVAVGGTVAAFLSRNKDSTDRRLDILFTANKDLVEDLRTERGELRTERTDLKVRLDVVEAELDALRELVQDQQHQLAILREQEALMLAWADEIMRWAAQAMTIIRGMNGTIQDPPVPPPRRERV